MPKPNKSRMKLSEMRAKRAEALGSRAVELEGDDGTVVTIPRMSFWDAETYENFLNEEGGLRSDMRTLERILPPEEFAKLQALKLELGDVADLIEELGRDAKRPESQGSSTR